MIASLLVGASAVSWMPVASAAAATPACPLYVNLLGKGWTTQNGGTVTSDGAHGFVINSPKAAYAEVYGDVSVDLSQYPILQMDISKVASGGQWNFTAQPSLNSQIYLRIGNNTNVTGVQTYNLEKIAQDAGEPTSGTYVFEFWPNGTNAPTTMTYVELLPAGGTCPANSVPGVATATATTTSAAVSSTTTTTTSTKTTTATTTASPSTPTSSHAAASLPKTGSAPLERGALAGLMGLAALALVAPWKRRRA